jgi:nonsense-mediated mRNA decay protein 3
MERRTLPTILCCVCGIGIEPNATNMCLNCLRDTVDVTQDINTKVTIHSCHNCGRFLGPPWQQFELESKELMVMCLRKINGLNKVKLIDAVWIWTEPHSLRLKVKLTVQKEIMTAAIIQQACVVEFIIRNQQCKHCEASFAQGAWHAIVQLRQRVSHKRTFYYLEQLILKYEAHTECIKIVTFRDGMDFYFKDKNQALRFIEFLTCHVPTKMKYSRKLVSADHSNNTADFKHNYLIEIAPICKDDLVLLPKDLSNKQSNISPLVLIKRVAAGLHVIDPLSGERTEINAEKYWRYGFGAMFSAKALTRFVVLSVEPVLLEQRASARMKRVRTNTSQQAMRNVSKLAECVVAREKDLGSDDTQFTVLTHLGPLLVAGDVVLGYDLHSANLNVDDEGQALLEKMSSLPDVILVRKVSQLAWLASDLQQQPALCV